MPVVCNGIRYVRITAIRFEGNKGVMLEMADSTGRGNVVAPPDIVSPADPGMFEAVRKFREK